MKPSLWLAKVDFRPAVTLRLVCFAHAGSGAAPFVRWGPSLPESVALCPVRRPGQELAWREPPLGDVDAIAEGSFAALATLPARPTVLFGHSLGAAVAFAVARRMEAAGRGPELLIVSAKPPVHVPSRLPRLAALPDAQFLDAVDATYGGIPPELRREPELMALVLPVLRADLTASESYRPPIEPRLRCPIRVCHGVDDRAVDAAVLPAWGDLTTGGFEIERFAGGHFFPFDSTHFVASLARLLAAMRA